MIGGHRFDSVGTDPLACPSLTEEEGSDDLIILSVEVIISIGRL